MLMEHLLPEGQTVGEGDEYQFAICPACEREKTFHWNLISEKGHCCGCKRSVTGYKNLRLFLEGTDCWSSATLPEVVIRELQLPEVEENAWFVPDARSFLIMRGVSQKQCFDCDISYSPSRECILIPVQGMSPELPAARLKRYYRFAKSKWYAEYSGFPQTKYVFDVRKNKNNPNVLFVEGIFDLLSQDLEDIGVALLGTATKDLHYKAYLDKTWYVWFDYDDAGIKATEEIKKASKIWGFPVVDLTNEYQVEPKNASEEIVERVRQLVE